MDITSLGLKKKRISKKRKSAWRKTDIKDVESFLEDQRLEERLGKPFRTLKDDEIFHIDVTPDTTLLSKREKRKLKAQEPPKCFSMLQSHSKVPDPIIKRNRVRTKEERRCPIVKKKEQERKLRGILKAKQLQRISDRQRSILRRAERSKTDIKDIWDESDVENNDWIEKLTKRHTLRGIGKLNKVIPRIKNTLNSILPKVESPHPGISYNPAYDDHQDLLRQIADKELKLIKEEKHLNRVTKDIFRKIPQKEHEMNWMTEMSQGLPHGTDKNSEENKIGNSENAYDSINPPVLNKKKTLQQRRKIKEQAELKENIKKAKIERKKVADIHKLKFITSKIERQEKLKETKQNERAEKRKTRKGQTRRLGKLKFEDPDLDFNLGEEIPGNLRNLKVEGNLLRDRFQSLQKRNVLDVTTRHVRKQGRKKRIVKSTFKEWEKTVVK